MTKLASFIAFPQPDDASTLESPTHFCPSARHDMAGAKIFGVVGGTGEQPFVQYLEKPVEATHVLVNSIPPPLEPEEVFRFAAPCAKDCCKHFTDNQCSLVKRVVQLIPLTLHRLPACAIRGQCVWFRQEGREACGRCTMIVTHHHAASPELASAADDRPEAS